MSRFASLRELLGSSPSETAFVQIISLLHHWEDSEERELALDYTRTHLLGAIPFQWVLNILDQDRESWELLHQLLTVDLLVRILSEGIEPDRWRTVGILKEHSDKEELLERLAEQLLHPKTVIQHWAVIALSHIGGLKAATILLTLDTPDPTLTRAQARAIGHLGAGLPSQALPQLLQMILENTNKKARHHQLIELIKYQPQGATRNAQIDLITKHIARWPFIEKRHTLQALEPLRSTETLRLPPPT